MQIVIDTNIVIDYLEDREPFAENAARLLNLCEEGTVTGMLTANAITDIYYVVHKKVGRERTLDAIKTLCSFLEIADIGKTDIFGAIELDMSDFEDALVAQCAKRVKADCIITRNLTDFKNSPVPAKEPKDFLQEFD